MSLERRLWALSFLVFVISATLISTSLWFLVSTTFGRHCSLVLNAANWTRCIEQQNFALDRASLLSSVVGIGISAVSTIALIITIIYTARATTAATEASKAAKAALDISKQSQLLELRPYMNVVGLSHSYTPDKNGDVLSRSLRITWENVGNTPALNVHSTINYQIFDELIPSDFDFHDQNIYGTQAGTVGKDKQIISTGTPISLDEIKLIISGDKKLHAWGWVEYEGFDGLTRYRTEYHASVIFYMSDDPRDLNLNIWFTIANGFNGSDDTCSFSPKTELANRKKSLQISV